MRIDMISIFRIFQAGSTIILGILSGCASNYILTQNTITSIDSPLEWGLMPIVMPFDLVFDTVALPYTLITHPTPVRLTSKQNQVAWKNRVNGNNPDGTRNPDAQDGLSQILSTAKTMGQINNAASQVLGNPSVGNNRAAAEIERIGDEANRGDR